MRGRKPQPMPAPNAFAMIPQFMYMLLGNGAITPAAFALWAMIRLFARDQKRNTFSPCSVALTTMQLAELFGSSETHIKNLIHELEAAHALERHTANNSRQLQLCAPVGIRGHSIYRLIDLPVTPQEEELAFLTHSEATPPPEALSPEGGVGGTNYQAPELRVNQMPGNQMPGNSLSPKAAIAALLHERGAFPRVANDIADVLIAAGITDLNEVRDLVNAVIRQVVAEGAKEIQVIGRAMSRLRNGDWDMDAVRGQALAAAQTAAYARYATVDVSEDGGKIAVGEDADMAPESASNGSSLARVAEATAYACHNATAVTGDEDADNEDSGRVAVADSTASVATVATEYADLTLVRIAEAAALWQQTLDLVPQETTKDVFNTWFVRSRGLGYNGDGNTLVVGVQNAAAVEILSGNLLRLVQRNLGYANDGVEVPVRFVIA